MIHEHSHTLESTWPTAGQCISSVYVTNHTSLMKEAWCPEWVTSVAIAMCTFTEVVATWNRPTWTPTDKTHHAEFYDNL